MEGLLIASLLRLDLGEFPLRSGEADLKALDFAKPALAFGFGDAGDEVVADVNQPRPLGRIGSEE
ncbi:hypothetical protein [Streptomyces sp. BE133]|uniref:hypothetical protein n=1 Tax=Streptomyces sp. BE133 TaxID=3002523 RepID=UPI002E7A808F|nr:hypothetical protein [Streptomyces sp. BE133]MEE1805119.1 hypothetical protein [Streptomyces sp. BE133]